MSYTCAFAPYYDRLNQEVDYTAWAEYLIKLMNKHNCYPSSILDLGCGTGNITLALHKLGYDMTGLDISSEMLSIASKKALKNNADILFINRDMCDFELYGTVDCVVSCLDCINYITRKRELFRCFSLVNLFLNKGGVFIFDINTPYKFDFILNGNTFIYDYNDVYCIWQNFFDKSSKLCQFDITVFCKSEKNYYSKLHEEQFERAYKKEEIKIMLKRAGFTKIHFYHEFTFSSPKKTSQRVFCIAQRLN